MLAMRLARPTRLVDVMRLPELAGVADEGETIVIGATTRQVLVERSDVIAEKLPLLASVMPWVGHPPTRTRGTIGGSIANADPSAEIPLVAATLNAEIVIQTATGEIRILAAEFFLSAMVTAIPAGGVLKQVRFPIWSDGVIGAGFHEVSARRSDFAFAAAAAQVRLDKDGRCRAAAIGVGGVADRPAKLEAASVALVGTKLSDADIRDAVADEIEALDAMSDPHASAAYRRRAARLLALRALVDARERARKGLS
jgi:CO/xanthine dehydrogenase FAD-binding subunit